MAPFSELLRRNKAYAASVHEPFPEIAEIEQKYGGPPKTIIITCIDPRVFPEKLLDLKWGEAFIFRTIAGHPQPIFQDLVVLDAVSHGFDEIIIMYHTDCGAHRFNDDFIRSELGKTDGKDQVPALKLPTLEESAEQSIRNDLAWMRSQPLLRTELAGKLKGYIYDLHSGEVRAVEDA